MILEVFSNLHDSMILFEVNWGKEAPLNIFIKIPEEKLMASGSFNQVNPSSSLEYKFHQASLATPKEKGETYHLIAEVLKFGNMLKPEMKDPTFSEAKVSYCSAQEY